ncbi:hypothetical protein PACTADRAFT_86543 [Pachysolen tannophilus NRRL Y-2460]|uniref:chitin deacetylase n=1 Tax=Pachysolen tannophilus NRRL Y-2460 TaxID=669874 RepID=A0A1E4TRJ1_PACTA|nr:hypothetical protein PACTADRAFT_86543 [Pachysolen tannophilus NRRL Y-2460]
MYNFINCIIKNSSTCTKYLRPGFSDSTTTTTNNNNYNDFSFNNGVSDAVGFQPHLLAQEPFPTWLTEFTGLTAWPGMDPPYIPLDFIDMNAVPKDIPPHQQGVCPQDRSSCSFDCYKCVSFDDAYTCPKMSQTFDDGPSPATPKLLENLNHKTTFFTLGINVVRFPEIYKMIQARGHLLASHTWSHPFLPSLTNEQLVAQFEWSIWAMNATGHHLPKWYRPPYGGIDNRVRAITRQFGMQAVLWDYDSFDWKLESNPKERTEQDIINDVKRWKSRSNPPKGLILEHDGAIKTVNAAIEVNKVIGDDQLTVSQCVDSIDYIKVYEAEDYF